ncbi:unnamed protein product, partial [Cyprideis torosa]
MAEAKMDIGAPSIEAPCTQPEITAKEEADETETTGHQPNRRMKQRSPKTKKTTIHYDYHSVRGDRFKQRLGNHAREKLFKCAYCDERFTQSADRKDHQNVHFKKEPHKCMYCDRRFTSGSDRNVHQRIHFGEKPYQCLLCPASFITAVALRVHLKSHKGERPFRCDLCGESQTETAVKEEAAGTADDAETRGPQPNRRTKRKSQKTKKATIHHDCAVCGRRFKQRSHLKDHERVHS